MKTFDPEQEVMHILKYFAQFSYPPLLQELYLFYPRKITKQELSKTLLSLIRHKRVIEDPESKNRYTIFDKKNIFELNVRRRLISHEKMVRIQKYIEVLSLSAYIQFVGLSGSVSMENAEENDDIDLFIISEHNRIWTARLYCIIFALIMGIKRPRVIKNEGVAKDKACLNLFFDKADMKIPPFKQTEYIAHELLQVVPVVNKNHTYEHLLLANEWALNMFPQTKTLEFLQNAPRPYNTNYSGDGIGNTFEKVCKWIQMLFIKRHRTTEYITDTQLWFFPNDYEQKLKKVL